MVNFQRRIPGWGILSLQALILIAPLPFGFSGATLSPLFFLLVLTWVAAIHPWSTRVMSLPGAVWLRRCAAAGIVLLFLQLLPLPRSVLGVISPATLRVLDSLPMAPVHWHGTSLVPGATVMAALSLLVMAMFFFTLARLPLDRSALRRIAMTVAVSGALQVGIGGGRMLLPGSGFFWVFHAVENPLTRLQMMGTLATNAQAALFLSLAAVVVAGLWAADAGVFGSREMSGGAQNEWRAILRRNPWPALLLTVCLAGFALSRCPNGRWILVSVTTILFLAWMYTKFPAHQRHWLRWFVIAFMALMAVAGIQRTRPTFRIAETGERVMANPSPHLSLMAADFPLLGAGAGSFGSLYPLYDPALRVHLSHAHNDWRQVIAETGYAGFFMLLIFLIIYAQGVVRMWHRRRDPWVRALAAGWMAAALLTPAFAFFHYPVRVPGLVFFAVLVMAMAVRTLTRTSEDSFHAR